jgi:hypothetical protein
MCIKLLSSFRGGVCFSLPSGPGTGRRVPFRHTTAINRGVVRKTYEAWIDGSEQCVTLGDLGNLGWQRSNGLLKACVKLLHRFEADTPEEAQAVHHIKMGWEPYRPTGEPALCPNGCGAFYYPQSSASARIADESPSMPLASKHINAHDIIQPRSKSAARHEPYGARRLPAILGP